MLHRYNIITTLIEIILGILLYYGLADRNQATIMWKKEKRGKQFLVVYNIHITYNIIMLIRSDLRKWHQSRLVPQPEQVFIE